MIEVAGDFAARGANVVIAGPNTVAPDLPVISGRAEVEPILTIQSFYMMANALALARGCNPDAPLRSRSRYRDISSCTTVSP